MADNTQRQGDVSNGPAAWAPPPAHPRLAGLRNVLCTRSQPWQVAVGTAQCLLSVPVVPQPFTPGLRLRVRCGGADWLLEVGQDFPLRLHPALAQAVPGQDQPELDQPEQDLPEQSLPEEVRLAVAELLAAPLAAELGGFLGTQVSCEALAAVHAEQGAATPPAFPVSSVAAGGDGCTLHLLLEVPAQGDGRQAVPVPLALHLPGEAADMLAGNFLRLPTRHEARDHVPVPVAVEAGRMRLSAAELAALVPGDILLPEDYPAQRGRLALSASGWFVHCAVENGQATVLDIANPGIARPGDAYTENPMPPNASATAGAAQPDDAAPNADALSATPSPAPEGAAAPEAASPSAAIDANTLEVTVVFELERRAMTVGDLAALAPGYTFALGADPLAPVTLCVGGRPVGTGRLVDLGGTLGVQVLSTGGANSDGGRP